VALSSSTGKDSSMPLLLTSSKREAKWSLPMRFSREVTISEYIPVADDLSASIEEDLFANTTPTC
jgi:hypothetical protein